MGSFWTIKHKRFQPNKSFHIPVCVCASIKLGVVFELAFLVQQETHWIVVEPPEFPVQTKLIVAKYLVTVRYEEINCSPDWLIDR